MAAVVRGPIFPSSLSLGEAPRRFSPRWRSRSVAMIGLFVGGAVTEGLERIVGALTEMPAFVTEDSKVIFVVGSAIPVMGICMMLWYAFRQLTVAASRTPVSLRGVGQTLRKFSACWTSAIVLIRVGATLPFWTTSGTWLSALLTSSVWAVGRMFPRTFAIAPVPTSVGTGTNT